MKELGNTYLQLNKEYSTKGDTMNFRRLIYKCLELYEQYKEEIKNNKIFEDLKNYYYEELIFTPTIEDIEEMKYWL